MKNNFLCFLLTLVFVFLCLNAFNTAVCAQDLDDVAISGRVSDSNNAPIAGATVTATLITTGIERTVAANGEGRYRMIELAPGTYSIKATMQGFAAQEKTGLETVAGQNIRLDFNLAPAGVNAEQIITLEGEDAPVIDTTRTVVGGTITEREIEEIPNFNRNALDLVLTLGGTSEESLSTNGLAEDRNANPISAPLEQGNFSLSGGTAYSNNLTIDGLDNNDDRSSRDRFQPSLESIAEVQVITNQFSAEYGRASGGRINIRTRSGGNKFRGRFFMFFRDDNLNANTWYNNSRAIPRPPLTEYNPGFTFNGPVILPFYNGKNKTFFSVAYEFDKFADTTLIDAYVPVGTNPRFTLPATTGGDQTCDNSSPAACTSVPPTAAFVSPYRKLFSTPSLNHVVTARVDHKLFKNNDLTVGWQFGRKNNKRTNGAATTRIEDAFQARNSNTDAYNFTDNQVFGANVVNQFRAQYSVFEPSFQTIAPLDPVVLISYRDPVSNSTKTLIAGNSTTSTSQNFADSRKETRWQFQDSLTYILSSHAFKGGFDVQRVNSQVLGLGDATGTFNFGSVLNYQNNVMSRYRQNFGTAQTVVNTYWGVFFNDELKAKSNLTVNYGLRYERETAVSDNNNFGPRLGIAWDPFKKGKGVIRFGAGIFYNRVLLRTVGDSIQNRNANLISFDTNTIGTGAADVRRIPILAAIAQRFPGSYASVAELKSLVTAACATIVTTLPCNANTGFITNVTSAGNPLRSVEPNLKIPESYQFNIGFEREIAKGFVFEANYTWNKTVHLWRDSNPNAPRLPAGYRDWTAYLLANPFVFSNANGTTRTYNFALGSTTDGSGVGTGCSFTATSSCTINLNTTSTTSTAPSTAVTGSSANATGSPLGIALAAIARFRPDQTVEETSLIGSRGNAFYHGLILELRSRYRKLGSGFSASMRFNYTLSSTRDDGLNNTANAEIDGDFSREFTRNLQDRRHRIALSGTFDLPWWLGKLKFSPLFRYGSSAPFNLSGGGSDRNLDDISTDRLNFSGNLKDIKYREPGSPFPEALAAQFSLQPIGAKSGNLPRNAGIGPSFYTFDLSVAREWKIGERMRLRPAIQFDNILNAAVFSYGSEFINFTGLSATATDAQRQNFRETFLVPTRTYRQRQIRLGIRFDF
ncbi:MAG TPA: carboxypeptidase regulatory-like domain-containing protein [Pyrinomonadaceae bacterium]|nr:carboxypeptidase regulatory-like domain-containing protein [Pyrinomonadaceae bacterium]